MMLQAHCCRISLAASLITGLIHWCFLEEVFDPQVAMKRYNRSIDWRKVMKGPEMDDEDELRKEHYKQQGVIQESGGLTGMVVVVNGV